MLIIPAIDIIDSKCVRLTKGDFNVKTIYSNDPLARAKQFEKEGAQKLHIVDLDGAKTGKPKNMELIIKLRKAIKIPIEVGGGIRDFATAERYLSSGIDQIITGTQALENIGFLQRLMKEFGPTRIIVAVDVKNGSIVGRGWQVASRKKFETLLPKLTSLGIKVITVTDVNRDGTLTRPNFSLIREMQKYGFKIIAAGGITHATDLQKLETMGIESAIIGKALYEGKLSLLKNNLAKRIIPCLDVSAGRVVKGIHFENLKDAGDPATLGKRYFEDGADELVFLDITASKEKRKTMIEVVKRVAQNVFIPFTVGGGVSSIEDIHALLVSGADKVCINTTALQNPTLIAEASKIFGAQCIVSAIDVKRTREGYKVYKNGGTEKTDLDAFSWAKKVESLGAGEILLTSMDQDGTKRGFDLPLLKKISCAVNIPVIASGGAGTLEDFKDAFLVGKADAVLAASVFHFKDTSIKKVKAYLQSFTIPVRL